MWGYLYVGVNRKQYPCHRVIWAWVTGEWPTDLVDHKDLDKINNRWKNLREATFSQNRANILPYKNNKSGFKGISWYKPANKWVCRIGIDGKRIHLDTSKKSMMPLKHMRLQQAYIIANLLGSVDG